MEWLHLCDFHIGGKSGPVEEALQSQLAAIEKQSKAESWELDAVFLVGDIAWGGSENEYDRFTELFLTPLRKIPALANVKIFSVPGNHDIECNKTLPITWEILTNRQSVFFSEDNDGLETRHARSIGFKNYSKWLNNNDLFGPDPLTEVSALHILTDLPVNILTTNTAFFSDYSIDSSLPATPIPLISIRKHLAGAPKDKPILILGHHSWRSLRIDQEPHLSTILRDNNAVYFHGHEHSTHSQFGNSVLKSLGFGACYPDSLKAQPDIVYKHTFTHCHLTDRLNIRAFTWEASGSWIDTTTSQFSDLEDDRDAKGNTVKIANFPILSNLRTDTSNLTVISAIKRTEAKPSQLIPVGAPNEDAWRHIFQASSQIRSILRNGTLHLQQNSDSSGKLEFSAEVDNERHLILCVPAINHVFSASEVEGYNTRLDSEDYSSVTVFSLGKVSDEANTLYIRLRNKKKIEILDNLKLTDAASNILSSAQRTALSYLDSATSDIRVLMGETEMYVLIIDSSKANLSFYVINSGGELLDSSHELVHLLRSGTPEFEKMTYAGEVPTIVPRLFNSFNESTYLLACRKEYNTVKYAALASAGIRFSDLPLDELYVSATASELQDDATDRLENVISDHLSNMAASESFKAKVKADLLKSLNDQTHKETSFAREFCQRYGVVLVIGDPGAGKTCFVKNEILAYCDRALPRMEELIPSDDWYSNHIPVMLMLSELAGEKDLEEKGLSAIASRLLSRRGISFSADELALYSKKGKIAWFFDGLDEVVSVERRAAIVQQINELVVQSFSSGNRVVVTSRPAAINVVNFLSALHKLEIQGLSEDNIRALAERVLNLKLVDSPDGVVVDDKSGTKPKKNEVIEKLLADCRSNPGVARLAQNPLLLTLLILIYSNSGAPSAKRHRIYEQAIQTLATVRGRELGHSKVSALSAEDLRDRLGAVAVSVYKKTSGLLPTRDEVCRVVKQAMTRSRGEEVSPKEANEFVQKVAESTGLIAIESRVGQPDGEAIITFMHHSFLEYFAAIGLSRELDTIDICDLVSQPRWHEVLTLLAGVIGENADITPILKKILATRRDESVPDINAKLLRFAMECALECDVPSESTQRLLVGHFEKCVSDGPARLDPWVRSELGTHIGRLIFVCGEGLFDISISTLISSNNEEICAAAIDISGYICKSDLESSVILNAIEASCTRIEEIVLCAICATAARSAHLRTEPIRQVIARCLKKSTRAKRFALEAISIIPGIAAIHWDEIISIISDGDSELVAIASKSALRAGLNADVMTLQAKRKDVLLRSLNSLEDVSAHDPAFAKARIKSETIDFLWSSAQETDHLLAIQLSPFCDASEQYLYSRLAEIVRDGTDRREVSAALSAFSRCDAASLIKHGDLKKIGQRLFSGTADVRLAATNLLSCFGAETVAIDALLSQNFRDLSVEHYKATMNALGHSKALANAVSARLFDEIEYFLNEERKATSEHNEMLISLFTATRQLKRVAKPSLVQKMREFIGDYRPAPHIKRSAIVTFPAISEPNPDRLQFLIRLFSQQAMGIERALVQIPGLVATKCKQNVDYVIDCAEELDSLMKVSLELYARISKRRSSDDTEYLVSQLRDGIDELQNLITAFHDFIEEPVV